MIPLWLSNIGEDFIIKRFQKDIEIVTYDNKVFTLKLIGETPLPIVGKTDEAIFVVYESHRLAFNKDIARTIRGVIAGQTKEAPKILHIPEDCCGHGCSKCGGCGHC